MAGILPGQDASSIDLNQSCVKTCRVRDNATSPVMSPPGMARPLSRSLTNPVFGGSTQLVCRDVWVERVLRTLSDWVEFHLAVKMVWVEVILLPVRSPVVVSMGWPPTRLIALSQTLVFQVASC